MSKQSQPQPQLDEQVQTAISNFTEEPEQIDAIAKIRQHYRVEEGSKYYPLLQEYLNKDNELPETMDRLFGPIYKNIHKFNQSEMQFFDLWHSVLHSATRIPFQDAETHKRLVDFVAAYKEQPHPSGMYDGFGSDTGGIFGSLYGFTYTIQSYWGDVPGHGSGSTDPEIHAWANLNCFWAGLTRDGVCDLWLRCIYAMREALEHDMEKRGSFKKFTAVQFYDSLVPAAAVWVFALQRKLHEKEEDMTRNRFSKRPDYAHAGALYGGPSSFNKERWRFWKERFSVIRHMQFLKDETRDLARRAFDIMEMQEPTAQEQQETTVQEPRYLLRSRTKKLVESA
jgi:hypothetical protein